eukprot:jgi/Mesen1/6448/ME000033S05735
MKPWSLWQHGARFIYETDVDNVLLTPHIGEAFDLSNRLILTQKMLGYRELGNRSVVNPYIHFGQPSMWPKGLPLDAVAANVPEQEYLVLDGSRLPLIKHGLVNGNPGVDALFRLTRVSRGGLVQVKFDPCAPPVGLPAKTMAPFSSQNTIFLREAFWGMMLPATAGPGVADIWRGYWAQRLLRDLDGMLAFYPPTASRNSSAQDQPSDAVPEKDSYLSARALVDFLLAWRSSKPRFFDRVLELSKAMAARGFWSQSEVELTAAWLSDLISVGYAPPALPDKELEEEQQQQQAENDTTVFHFRPLSLQSSDLAVPKVVQPGRAAELEKWAAMRARFEGVVLILNYNHHEDVPKSASFLRALYGRVFDTIHMISGEEVREFGVHKAPYVKPFQSYSKAWYAYAAIPGIMAAYPHARGFLWTNDDIVLDYWRLARFDKLYSVHITYVKRDYPPDSGWWRVRPFQLRFGKFLQKLPRRYRQQLQASFNETRKDFMVKVVADFFYIPMRLRDSVAQLTPIFAKFGIMSEVPSQVPFYPVAVPTMLSCIEPGDKYEQLTNHVVLWQEDRLEKDWKYNTDLEFLHPWKLTPSIEKDKMLAAMAGGDPFL